MVVRLKDLEDKKKEAPKGLVRLSDLNPKIEKSYGYSMSDRSTEIPYRPIEKEVEKVEKKPKKNIILDIANRLIKEGRESIGSVTEGRETVLGSPLAPRDALEMPSADSSYLDKLKFSARVLPRFATDPIAEIGAQVYMPGAGMGVVNNAYQGAGNLIGKVAPKLANSRIGRVAEEVIKDVAVSAPVEFGYAAKNAEDNKELLKQTAIGTGIGAGAGGLISGAIEGVQALRRPVRLVDLQKAELQPAQREVGSTVEPVNPYQSELDEIAEQGVPEFLQPKPIDSVPIVEKPLRDYIRVSNLESELSIASKNFEDFKNRPDIKEKEFLSNLEAEEIIRLSNKKMDIENELSEYRKSTSETPTKPKVTRLADLRAETPVVPVAKVETTIPKTETPRGIRANFANQLDNGNLSDDLTQKIKNTDQTYEIKTNQASVNAADEVLKDMSTATAKFLNNEAGGAEHIALGYKLQKRLDAEGKYEEALAVSRKLASDLTNSGQTSQAARIISRLSPEGQLLDLVRTAEKNGKTVTVEDSIKFKALAAKKLEKDGAGIRENQFTEILNRMEKGEDISVGDIKTLSDYLSGAEKSVKPKAIKEIADDLPAEFKDVKKRDKIVSYLDEAEKAALARIAARKGKVSAMVLPDLGEWSDHMIVASAQIAKGSIKAATHVEDLVKLFGEEIRPVASEVFRKAQGLVKGVTGGVSEGNVLKANQAFKRISGQEKGTLQENIVEKYLKENPKVSPKDIDSLRKLAKSVTKLEGAEKIDADIAMQRILNSYEKSNAWDKVQAVRYMGMLLNTHTQAINAISGPIMATVGTTADVFGTMIDIAMHATLKTPRSTTLYGTNPLRFIAGYVKHIKTGARAGWHGVNPSGIQSTNEIRGLAFKSNWNPLNWAERTLGAVAKGADYATYRTVYDSEILKQARLSATNKKLKGKDIKNHIKEYINDPPEEAMLDADRIGKNTTFQRSDSTGGKVANYLNNAPTLVKPGVNAIFPFVRTPINMASSAVTLTPAGIIKGLFQLAKSDKVSQREAIRTLSLGVTGTGIGVLGYHLMDIGIITGGNDSGDKNVDNIREQAGKGKYRFNQTALIRYLGAMVNGEGFEAAEKAAEYKQGDHQFDYNKLQPLAFPLAAGASVAENKDKKLVGQVGGAIKDSYGSLYGMSTLKGVQNVFQPSYGGTQGDKALGPLARVAESFAKSFSWGGLAQEARRQDPIQRNTPFNDGITENTKGYFKSRIPGMSKDLPARKTTLGQDYKNAEGVTGAYLNPYRSEVAPYNEAAQIIAGLIERTGDMKLAPTAPEKSVSGSVRGERVTIKIPAKRYEQLQEDVGDEIIKRILELPKLDDDKMAERIEDIYTDVRRLKMNEVKRENGIKVN